MPVDTYVIKPAFERMVGRWRMNDMSRGLSTCRGDIPSDCFGHISDYWCDRCGPISEPETVCTQKETWDHWGGQPAEYEWVCPVCDGYDCGENDSPNLDFKVVSRSRLRLRSSSGSEPTRYRFCE